MFCFEFELEKGTTAVQCPLRAEIDHRSEGYTENYASYLSANVPLCVRLGDISFLGHEFEFVYMFMSQIGFKYFLK